MSPFARIASIPVASVAAVGLVFGIVVAPPADCGTVHRCCCGGPTSDGAELRRDSGSARCQRPADRPPTLQGERQRAAAQAGPDVPRRFSAHSRRSRVGCSSKPEWHRHPCPRRSRRGGHCSTRACARACAAARPARARNIACRLGDRTEQPERHHQAFRDHRNRPRNHVGQRGSRQQSGADGFRRHDPATAACTASSGGTTRCSAASDGALGENSQHPQWRCEQQVLRFAAVGPRLSKQVINSIKCAPTETGIIPTSGISVGGQRNTSASCPSGAGTRTARGRRTSRRSRCPPTTANTGASTPEPSGPLGGQRFRGPATFREMRSFSRAHSSSPGPATHTSTRTGHRPDAAAPRMYRGSRRPWCRS